MFINSIFMENLFGDMSSMTISHIVWQCIWAFIITITGGYYGRQYLRNIVGECSPDFACYDPRSYFMDAKNPKCYHCPDKVPCTQFSPFDSGQTIYAYAGDTISNSTKCWLDHPIVRFTDPMDDLVDVMTIMLSIYVAGTGLLMIINIIINRKHSIKFLLYSAGWIAISITIIAFIILFLALLPLLSLNEGMCTDYYFNWGASGIFWNVQFWKHWGDSKYESHDQHNVAYYSIMPILPARCWQDGYGDITFNDPKLSLKYFGIVLGYAYGVCIGMCLLAGIILLIEIIIDKFKKKDENQNEIVSIEIKK